MPIRTGFPTILTRSGSLPGTSRSIATRLPTGSATSRAILPVAVSQKKNPQGQPAPEFSITVATSDAVAVDPRTGAARPAQTDVLNYQLESGMVKRVVPAGPQGPAPVSANQSRREPMRIAIMARGRLAASSLGKAGCPISRSFFARCGIPPRLHSDSRCTRCTYRPKVSGIPHLAKNGRYVGTRPWVREPEVEPSPIQLRKSAIAATRFPAPRR